MYHHAEQNHEKSRAVRVNAEAGIAAARPARNSSPPKRLAKASASSGLAKQNTTKSLSSRRKEVREYAIGYVYRGFVR
jgi:hypothetical protein